LVDKQLAFGKTERKMVTKNASNTPSIRKTLEAEIQELRDELLCLSNMVEQQLLGSVEALKKRDIEQSRKIVQIDLEVNKHRYAIEERVMVIIATQQPMAHDLRLLASFLEIAGELERMGDYAKGIAKISIDMGNEPLLKPLLDIPRMAEKCVDMLHRAVAAFIAEDAETAVLIPNEDDLVDNLYDQIYREMMVLIIQNPAGIQRANWLLWVAHNLERVADRVTNICERTVFVVSGVLKEIGNP
jgi:phosphate transport system protein